MERRGQLYWIICGCNGFYDIKSYQLSLCQIYATVSRPKKPSSVMVMKPESNQRVKSWKEILESVSSERDYTLRVCLCKRVPLRFTIPSPQINSSHLSRAKKHLNIKKFVCGVWSNRAAVPSSTPKSVMPGSKIKYGFLHSVQQLWKQFSKLTKVESHDSKCIYARIRGGFNMMWRLWATQKKYLFHFVCH